MTYFSCYVSSVSNRLDRCDREIIKALTDEFTPKIWENTILVLSFANQHCNRPRYVDYTLETAEVFQNYVRQNKGCQSVTVSCIYSDLDIR